MKAQRYVVIELDTGDELSVKVGGIKDDQFAGVSARVVPEGKHPAVVFGRSLRMRHEGGLAWGELNVAGDVLELRRADFIIMLGQGVEAPGVGAWRMHRCHVAITVFLPLYCLVRAHEFRRKVADAPIVHSAFVMVDDQAPQLRLLERRWPFDNRERVVVLGVELVQRAGQRGDAGIDDRVVAVLIGVEEVTQDELGLLRVKPGWLAGLAVDKEDLGVAVLRGIDEPGALTLRNAVLRLGSCVDQAKEEEDVVLRGENEVVVPGCPRQRHAVLGLDLAYGGGGEALKEAALVIQRVEHPLVGGYVKMRMRGQRALDLPIEIEDADSVQGGRIKLPVVFAYLVQCQHTIAQADDVDARHRLDLWSAFG